jgi:GNAT superfamily N-acetyltransferase
MTDETLDRHLQEWLGAWPPSGAVEVVGSPARTEPGWDGEVHPLVGVLTPTAGVISVPPEAADAVRDLVGGRARYRLAEVHRDLARAVGRPGAAAAEGIFRSAVDVPDLGAAGVWTPAEHPSVPAWLRPFGDRVLIASDDAGTYLAGVGLKRHNPSGREIAVGTEVRARGRGLARRLVAQAAREIIAGGAAVTYLHAPDNVASAHVAEASGFPDRGWRVLGLFG